LVEPKNVEAVRDAMIYLAQHPEVRSEFGRQGREHIIANYSHKVVAKRLENFFHSL